MSSGAVGIEHKIVAESLAATVRANIEDRAELPPIVDRLARAIPAGWIAGPPFALFNFISSVESGFDFEVGLPVTRPVETGAIQSRVVPAMEVLSLVHEGPLADLRQTYGTVYGYAAERAVISDEFAREVYLDLADPQRCRVEVQFVVHDWAGLLARNLDRVLGEDLRREVVGGGDAPGIEASAGARYHWVRGAVGRLDGMATDDQTYEILSRCAHVFPQTPIDKLAAVYAGARAGGRDPLQAVDAVLDFMDRDRAWGVRPVREGRVVYATKNPRDPRGYAEAQTEAQKRRAYCFCPLVRDHLEEGEMPDTFCYCSAGWERRQWEGALGRPVRVRIVQSLLRGDDRCRFAIELPDDL